MVGERQKGRKEVDAGAMVFMSRCATSTTSSTVVDFVKCVEREEFRIIQT